MSKKLMFKLFLGLSILAAAIFWLITVVSPDAFGDVNAGSWAILIVSGAWGIGFIVNGLVSKNVGVFKKLYILTGAGMLVVALFVVVTIFTLPDNIIMPIIAIIIASALILCLLAVGGKKWDQGDNENVGYKNYYQRKAEEEKENKD